MNQPTRGPIVTACRAGVPYGEDGPPVVVGRYQHSEDVVVGPRQERWPVMMDTADPAPAWRKAGFLLREWWNRAS